MNLKGSSCMCCSEPSWVFTTSRRKSAILGWSPADLDLGPCCPLLPYSPIAHSAPATLVSAGSEQAKPFSTQGLCVVPGAQGTQVLNTCGLNGGLGDRGPNPGSSVKRAWGSVGGYQGYPVMLNKAPAPASPRGRAHGHPSPTPDTG